MIKKNNSRNTAIFNAWIKWGSCHDSIPEESIPSAFHEAKSIWVWGQLEREALKKMDENDPSSEYETRNTEYDKQLSRACDLISPFVSCSFNPENMGRDISGILNIHDQINSKDIKVFGLHYSGGIFPIIRAEAIFSLPAVRVLTEDIVNEWEEDNDALLAIGVCFSWDIPNVDEWFLMYEESAGMDFVQMA